MDQGAAVFAARMLVESLVLMTRSKFDFALAVQDRRRVR
jgi:hypothetical protein